MEASEIKVVGRVQGVGFRMFTLTSATELGIRGWVKNLPDGSVLCRALGDGAAMAQFRLCLRKGPTFSRVEALEETPLDAETLAFVGFHIRH